MLNVDVSSDLEISEVEAPLVERFLGLVFERVANRAPETWSLTVRIADADEISRLHAQFFGDAADTDVMSFPSGDYPDSAGGYLGDIAISAQMAEEQASEQGHTTQREILFLAAHGLLHLLGFDDTSDSDRERMLQMQRGLQEDFERVSGTRM